MSTARSSETTHTALKAELIFVAYLWLWSLLRSCIMLLTYGYGLGNECYENVYCRKQLYNSRSYYCVISICCLI